MKSILIIEDDQTLGSTLLERLGKEGYQVSCVSSKAEATEALESSKRYDLLIVDVGLPDGSGLDLIRDLPFRQKIPIIFLSAMSSAEFRLEGFELGAQDYIPKPFHLKEMLLRVRRVLGETGEPQLVKCDDCIIDFEGMAVRHADGAVELLAQRDTQLLKYLINTSPRAVTREEVIKEVWREESAQTGRSVDNAILRLRQCLRSDKHIRSVRGVGYQWM